MAETTVNVTVPHTSAEISYSSSNNWFVDCPLTNGVPICGDVGGTFQGNHFSNTSTATFSFNFYGKAFAVYGSADSGMQLKISFSSIGSEYAITPGNGLLFSTDDFTTICAGDTYSCRDYSATNTGSGYNYNSATISATQFVVGSAVHLEKIVYEYPTHRTGATVSLKTYQNNDTAIQYSTGWSRNGTYMQAGDDGVAKTFSLTFNGPAVWIWQFCGQRVSGLDFGDYGTVTINGDTDYPYMSLDFDQPIPQDAKCLSYFKGNLYDQGNSLTFSSRIYNTQIHSIDVLQVEGGTPTVQTTTSGGYTYTYEDSPYSTSTTTRTNGSSKGVLIAVPVVLISLAVAAGIIVAFFVRKSRKAKAAAAAAAAPGYAASGPPMTTPTKSEDPGLAPPPHAPYLMYTPPPPATPAAPAVTSTTP